MWSGVAIATAVGCLIYGRRRALPLRRSFPVPALLQGAVLLIAVAGIRLDLPFRVRYTLSRAALQHAADDIRGGQSPTFPTWIGLFHVRAADSAGGAVRFVTGTCFLDECGLAHSRAGEPPRVGEDSYVHLTGPWWRWRRSW